MGGRGSGRRPATDPSKIDLQVFWTLEKNPGATVTWLSKALGRDRSTVRFHLKQLERFGLVKHEQRWVVAQ